MQFDQFWLVYVFGQCIAMLPDWHFCIKNWNYDGFFKQLTSKFEPLFENNVASNRGQCYGWFASDDNTYNMWGVGQI